MDHKVSIKIIRSDKKEFLLDGTDWRIPSDGLDGFGLFENDINTIPNGIGDGVMVASIRSSSRDRTIKAVSRNPHLNDVLRRSAISFFNSRYDFKIYITYMGLTRWCEAKIYKFECPLKNTYRTLDLNIVFLCPSPYLKSFEDFGKNIASVTARAGFPFMCMATRGRTAGVYNFAQKVVLENDGDVETYCKAVFKANGEVENPKLIIKDNYVKILDTMQDNDVIIIDFTVSPPTVTKNGANFIGHADRDSSFFGMELIVGDNEVQFDADNGTNLLEVSIYYNKLYGAI